ncbi:MAG: TRAM domain-containing protein [Halosimplex sp.]
MEISEQLRCLFSGRVDEEGGSYVVEVPKREIEQGSVRAGETYRVALVPAPATDGGDGDPGSAVGSSDTRGPERDGGGDGTEPDGRADRGGGRTSGDRGRQRPPVEEDETRRVEIEDLGDQGDGITRVERGFVVIVPDTEQGERVEVEITDVRETVAFAEVVERLSYYE